MADTKITALAAIATVDPAADVLPIVVISDTSMAASGTTKKVTSNQILGAGGTATLASATITGAATVGTTLGVTGVSTLASAVVTGALTVDTATLVVDPTNDRVGIGTTTPAYKLEVATGTSGQQALASFRTADTTAANNAGIQIYATPSSTAASRSVLLSLDADGADASGGDYFIIQKSGNSGQVDLNQQSNAAMTFSTNGTERARITASGDVNITTGNLVMSTSGKGIDFSATTPDGTGTPTSELLNDYEEGTFTATLKGGTTDPTVPVTTTGKYTKTGRTVFVQIEFAAVSTVGASGTVFVTGLPFTSASGSAHIGCLGIELLATFTNSALLSYIQASSSTLYFYTSTSNSTLTTVAHNAGINRYLWAAITYTV